MGRAPHYEELEGLKAEGKLRVYGVSRGNSRDLQTVLETTRSGAIEVTFNVFHQEPRAAFRCAQERGVGLIVNVPLDSGWLSGKYRGDSRFTGVRRRWSPDVIARRARLVEQVAALVPPGVSLVHAALRYVLAQPEVSTVIPGAKTKAQVRENAAAGEGRLPDDVVRALDALWARELRTIRCPGSRLTAPRPTARPERAIRGPGLKTPQRGDAAARAGARTQHPERRRAQLPEPGERMGHLEGRHDGACPA